MDTDARHEAMSREEVGGGLKANPGCRKHHGAMDDAFGSHMTVANERPSVPILRLLGGLRPRADLPSRCTKQP